MPGSILADYPAGKTRYSERMELSILQWNIWYRESAERIFDVLRSVNADVLLLQEVTVNGEANRGVHIAEHLAQRLGYDTHFDLPQPYGEGENRSFAGNAILSRFPLTDRRVEYIRRGSGVVGDFTDENRVYLEAASFIGGRRYTFGTTHLSYAHRFGASPKKDEERDALVRAIGDGRDSFVFGGDLNATPDSALVRAVTDQLRHAGPTMDAKTWTTKPFDYNGFSETELRWRPDYVFHSPDLRVNQARILEVDASDHLPILATFSLPGAS